MKPLNKTLALALVSITCCGISLAQTQSEIKEDVKAANKELNGTAKDAKADVKAEAKETKQEAKDAKAEVKAEAKDAKVEGTKTEKVSKDIKADLAKVDHVIMKDGVMMMVKDGKSLPLESDLVLKNGTMIMKDGNVLVKDSEKKMMLEEGGAVTIDGVVMKPEVKKEVK